jgi:hypothetical protein
MKHFIDNWVIYSCIALTFFFEVILTLLVYNKIGSERVGIGMTRMFIQIFILICIANLNFKFGVYLLTFYHVIVGLSFLSKINVDFQLNFIFILYHFCLGLAIYFNKEIQYYFKKE